MKNKKQQLPTAKFLLVGTIIAFGIFLIVPSTIPAHGFYKETALLKKYDNLQELVNDIRNGNVDFKDFRESDGIALAVMKDSEIYDEVDIATKDCIDFAGKVGNSLGDREIVHCSEDPNYFKNKFSSNTSVSTANAASRSIGSTVTKNQDTLSSSANSPDDKNDIVEKLVKTGRFTVQEAKEILSKMKYGADEKTSTANITSTLAPNIDSSAQHNTASTKIEGNKDDSSTMPDQPEDYMNFDQLVHDIKNGDLDADRTPLKDFQNSEAYKRADEQTKDCINFAGKVGKNLDDSEIVHCSEDTNYFKNKYSPGAASSLPASSTTPHPADTGNVTSDTNLSTQANGTLSSSRTRSTPSANDINKNILIDELVNTGKFTEDEAIEFSIIHELVNKQKFTENDAINFAKKIMQSRNQMESANNDGLPIVTMTPNNDSSVNDVSTTSNTNNKTGKASSTSNSDSTDNPAKSKDDNPEDYIELGKLVHDIKNGDLDADRTSLKDFQNSEAYKRADEQTKDCINFAGKVGKNLDDSEIVHCAEDTNYFKNKYSSTSDKSIPADATAVPLTSTGTNTKDVTETTTGTTAETTKGGQNDTSSSSRSTSTPSAGNNNKNELIDKLMKTGKFTEDETKEFAAKNAKTQNQDTSASNDLPTVPKPNNDTDTPGDLSAAPKTSNTGAGSGDSPKNSNAQTNPDDASRSHTDSNTIPDTEDSPSTGNNKGNNGDSNSKSDDPED